MAQAIDMKSQNTKNDMRSIQVERSHYLDSSYMHKHRWMSYWYQIEEIANLKDIKSLLEVGPGTTLVRDVLAWRRPDITYRSVDIAEDVQPDVIGDITDIPLPDNSVDCVCAFQVLEHLPFEEVERALKELARVSKTYALVSLPHFGPSVEFHLKIPFLPMIRFAFKIPYPKKHTFNGQHYWEIGKKEYSLRRVRTLIRSHFVIEREYVPFENQYHRFYVLKKF